MAPAIFKNMVFATAGPLPDQMTDENIRLWAQQRRGRFSTELHWDVTHLLCTEEQVLNKVPRGTSRESFSILAVANTRPLSQGGAFVPEAKERQNPPVPLV